MGFFTIAIAFAIGFSLLLLGIGYSRNRIKENARGMENILSYPVFSLMRFLSYSVFRLFGIRFSLLGGFRQFRSYMSASALLTQTHMNAHASCVHSYEHSIVVQLIVLMSLVSHCH